MEIDAQLRCRNCGWNGTRSELTPLGSVGRLHCPVCNAEYGTRDGVPAAGADVGLLPEDSRFFMKPSLDLSLYHLDRDLAGLLEYREERLADKESPATPEEMTALDGEIRRYMEALPRKVSGVVAVKRNWRAQKAAAKAEIDRLRAIVAHLESMETRLDEYCAEVLENQPEPRKGCKKLTGADGSVLMLKGNGGVQPMNIDPQLVPSDYCRALVRMPKDLYEALEKEYDGLKLMATEPDNALIRETLERPCPVCAGYTVFSVGRPENATASCGVCGGSGKQGVPGAQLLERGKHIEIR